MELVRDYKQPSTIFTISTQMSSFRNDLYLLVSQFMIKFNVSMEIVFDKTYKQHWAVCIIAASGKEAITPVQICIQAFASLKCRKDRISERDNKGKNIKFTPVQFYRNSVVDGY